MSTDVKIKPGSLIAAQVRAKSKTDGLLVNLPHQYTGRIGLNDISDTFHHDPTEGYEVGQIVECRVLKVDTKKHSECALSLMRQSR